MNKEFYTVDIAGRNEDLPIIPLSNELKIAFFNLHGNSELTEYCGKKLAEILEKKGRIVLLFNTDGIWYKGAPYHGEGEGDGLGQWHNDHVRCKFRMKSAGAYEFIENGVYTPVVRGVSLEKREGWQWGDIYTEKAEPDILVFDEERGVLFNGKVV